MKFGKSHFAAPSCILAESHVRRKLSRKSRTWMGSLGVNSWCNMCVFFSKSRFCVCLCYCIPGIYFLTCTCDSREPLWSHVVLSWVSLVVLCRFASFYLELRVFFVAFPSFSLSFYDLTIQSCLMCRWLMLKSSTGSDLGHYFVSCQLLSVCLGLESLLRILLPVALLFVLFFMYCSKILG